MPFDNSSHFVVGEATFTNIVNNGISDLHFLYQHVARGASYDSKDKFEKPKCDPNTRLQLLSDIQEWIKVADKETGIMFMHGPAGSGKSCIARSVCEQAAAEGLLGASFFFWRGSSSRNNEVRLVTTLAYQLAQGNKELSNHILSEIAQNPHIVEMPPEIQFRKLVIEPCVKTPRENLSARVIVIDGLDECMGEETQICILQMLARAVRHEGIPLGFFVTSRPELHIQEALDSKEIIFATNVISLNGVPGVSQDIRTVLESGFIRILNNPRFKRAMKSLPLPWPTPESINQLVQRSSDQFIYAATVLKFVSDPDSIPASQLEIVLGIKEHRGPSSESPFANLDLLYHQIMSRVKHPELTKNVLSFVIAMKDLGRREIITKGNKVTTLTFSPDITRAVLYNQNRLLLVIEQLLELSEGAAYSALNQLHSLISLKVGSDSTRRHLEIDFYHKSFEDYLTKEERSTSYYVNLKKTHNELAQSCLKFMGLPIFETESQHVGWLYSCFQWAVHRKFADRGVSVSSNSETLQRFISGSTHYLNVPNLGKALQALALVGNTWTEFFNHIKASGSLSLDDLLHAVGDVRLSMGYYHVNIRDSAELKFYNKLYAYPVWRKLLESYNNDSLIKQLLLVCHIIPRSVADRMSGSDICNLLCSLGLITNEPERVSVLAQYKEIMRQVDYFMDRGKELNVFLLTSEFSQSFHCKPEDVTSVSLCYLVWNMARSHTNLSVNSRKPQVQC